MPIHACPNLRAQYILWLVLGVPYENPSTGAAYHRGVALSRQNWHRVLVDRCQLTDDEADGFETLLERFQERMQEHERSEERKELVESWA